MVEVQQRKNPLFYRGTDDRGRNRLKDQTWLFLFGSFLFLQWKHSSHLMEGSTRTGNLLLLSHWYQIWSIFLKYSCIHWCRSQTFYRRTCGKTTSPSWSSSVQSQWCEPVGRPSRSQSGCSRPWCPDERCAYPEDLWRPSPTVWVWSGRDGGERRRWDRQKFDISYKL